MAVNIYDALAALEARVAKLEAPPAPAVGRLALVSYFRSATMWSAALAAKPVLCMINPGNGPGPRADSLYVAQVPKNRAAGVLTFGYVYTDYAAVPAATVKTAMANHKAWYGVDGIFIDETSVDRAHLPYYQDLCNYAASLGLRVILNPGAMCLEEHFVMVGPNGFVMSFENTAAAYLTSTRPAFEKTYASRVWHCIHTCTAAQSAAVRARAALNGCGLLTVTADVMPNPYDTLPELA
jgi:hypothetical protein